MLQLIIFIQIKWSQWSSMEANFPLEFFFLFNVLARASTANSTRWKIVSTQLRFPLWYFHYECFMYVYCLWYELRHSFQLLRCRIASGWVLIFDKHTHKNNMLDVWKRKTATSRNGGEEAGGGKWESKAKPNWHDHLHSFPQPSLWSSHVNSTQVNRMSSSLSTLFFSFWCVVFPLFLYFSLFPLRENESERGKKSEWNSFQAQPHTLFDATVRSDTSHVSVRLACPSSDKVVVREI